MVIASELWARIRCIACARPADHALELLLPIPRGTLTPVIVGFCGRHYEQAKRSVAWNNLHVVEAAALEPKGVG